MLRVEENWPLGDEHSRVERDIEDHNPPQYGDGGDMLESVGFDLNPDDWSHMFNNY